VIYANQVECEAMDRRQLLKGIAPLAAVVAAPLTVGEGTAQAYELKPEKRYVFVFGNVKSDDYFYMQHFQRTLKNAGIEGIALYGDDIDLSIHELDK
jgi:hypothetical protein